MKSLIINSSNLVSTGFNNQYKYVFPTGSVRFENDQMAVSSINMFFSWFNITGSTDGTQYNNNQFSYVWYYGATSTTVNINISTGYYTISSLNQYCQSIMIQNGHYLITASGQYVFYLEFVENSTYYGVQFNSYPIPTSLPVGYTAPGSWPGFPTTATTPQIIISSSNNFKDILGFNAGTYPSVVQNSNYSKISDYTPTLNPSSSLLMTCNILDNKISLPSGLLYSFTSGSTAFGGMIDIKPPQYSFIDIQNGSYTDFIITFYDSSFRNIKIQDTNVCILLTIRNKKETP